MNLLGAFLHAKNDQDVVIFMRGRLAELMSLLAPETYPKYIIVKKGQKV